MSAVQKPKPVAKGPGWLRKAFDERDKYAESIKPVAGEGISISESKSGTTINAASSTSSNPIVGARWDSEVGALVFTFADGTVTQIAFAECPEPEEEG